jgi:hypothetical protein
MREAGLLSREDGSCANYRAFGAIKFSVFTQSISFGCNRMRVERGKED